MIYTNPYGNFSSGGNFGNSFQQAPMQPQQDPIFRWVPGKAGAEAFSMAPGQSAFLMDSNEPILYAKATDSYGRYMPLQSYRLVPIEDQSMTSAAQIPQAAEPIDYDKIRQMIAEEVAKIQTHDKKETR